MRHTVRGVEIDAEVAGSGRSLLWGHGLMGSRDDEDEPPSLIDWSAVRRVARVARYDARGHGRSGYSDDPAGYGWDELARDQLVLADALGLDRFVAGGASMGAATALQSAVLAPDRIDGLLLVTPPTGWGTRAAQVDMYRQMADIVEARGVEPLISAGATVPPPDPFVGDEAYRARRADRMRRADPHRLAGTLRGAATADLPPPEAVAAIVAPTLILAWSGDPAHPVDTAERLAELLPSAELSIASTADELAGWTGRISSFVAPDSGPVG